MSKFIITQSRGNSKNPLPSTYHSASYPKSLNFGASIIQRKQTCTAVDFIPKTITFTYKTKTNSVLIGAILELSKYLKPETFSTQAAETLIILINKHDSITYV